jgi:hypothetical protein
MSSAFFLLCDQLFKGIEPAKSKNWVGIYPEKQSYVNRLDSLLVDPSLINKPDKDLLGQYYLLKSALQDYRNIEKRRLESYCDTSEKL